MKRVFQVIWLGQCEAAFEVGDNAEYRLPGEIVKTTLTKKAAISFIKGVFKGVPANDMQADEEVIPPNECIFTIRETYLD